MNQIVTIQHREAVTTSLKVAEIFSKRHKAVLKAIENLIDDLPEKDRHNFRPIFVDDSYCRKQPAYKMNRTGFSLLAMGFTGKKPLEFKLKFLQAFNLMETALSQRRNLAWQEERNNGKTVRRIETDTIANFVEYATAQGSQNATKYYMSITSMTHKALSLVKQSGTQSFRNLLDSMQLSCLTVAEYIVHDVLEDGMNAGLHYKDIYLLARESVEKYANTLPRHRRLMAV